LEGKEGGSVNNIADLFDLPREVIESRFDGTPLEPIALVTQKMVAWLPVSTNVIRDLGPLPGDEEEYAKRTKPYRRGILSERRLRDKRVTRERLIRDSKALRYALRWAAEDLVDYRSWGDEQAAEAARLRARIDEIFSYLTPEQRNEVYRQSKQARNETRT
jgi:hypothetical protein